MQACENVETMEKKFLSLPGACYGLIEILDN